MQPHVTSFGHTHCPLQTNQFRAGFNLEGPYIEVGFPGFMGYPSFGAGFDPEGPYIDDEFPNWLFGSPYIGPGPFSW